MRASQGCLATAREAPADAETASHRLMVRAGLVRQLASGLYTWLPIGLRALRRVEGVVRDEMDRAGAAELLMPMVQPADLWRESRRWSEYGPELLRLRDRHEREFCLGPTHEEVITELVKNQVSSYRQLPLNLYQIQTKFRDERRPRFGVMRAREFVMKDAYSFHADADSLVETYDAMRACYARIFARLGLEFRAVLADTGNIGGHASHEFHALADAGEDRIAISDRGGYAANVELAEAVAPSARRSRAARALRVESTPGARGIDAVCAQLGVPASRALKALVVAGEDAPLVALFVRGDHALSPIKAAKLAGVASPLRLAGEPELAAAGLAPGCVGPIGLKLPAIVDRAAAALADFACGANEAGAHFTGANWERDCECGRVEDLREVVAGDPSPDRRGALAIRRGIEVGHVFQLGQKYSRAMGAALQDRRGERKPLWMGCYGIGISRVVAAAIEQGHDERGILWPAALSPFELALVPLNAHRSTAVRETAERLYAELAASGADVLYDDRDERAGVKFADCELIGAPHRLVVSERGLRRGVVEHAVRRGGRVEELPLNGALGAAAAWRADRSSALSASPAAP